MGLDVRAAPGLAAFERIVAVEGRRLGLTGSGEAERLIERHVLESCALYGFFESVDRWFDVGPGAGFPGVPLAIVSGRPLTAIERSRRAASFLRTVAAELGVSATIVNESVHLAAHAAYREAARAVVTRALAPPAVVLELTLPLLQVGGRLAALVGPDVGRNSLGPAADALGGGAPAFLDLEVPGASGRRWVMIVDKVAPTPARYPRRPDVARRRPLGGGVTGEH